MNTIITFLKKYYILAILISVVTLGTILRFKGLLNESYWLDELFSISFSNPKLSFREMLNMTLSDFGHPPLYQSLLWISYKCFGYTEIVGRSLSAVIGSLGIIAMYYLGKEFFNKNVALYAVIITSVNYLAIYYSQEVRSLSLVFLFSALSYLLFIKVLTHYTKKRFLLYILINILLCYTHYIGFLLITTQVFVLVFYLMYFPKERKQLIILGFFTAVIMVICLIPIINHILQVANRSDMSWFPPLKWFYFMTYISRYISNYYVLVIFFFTGLATVIPLFKKSTHKQDKINIAILLIWLSIGFLIPYLKSIVSQPIFPLRSSIILLPALILVIAFGMESLKLYRLNRILLSLSVILLIIGLQKNYYHKTSKDQWIKDQWREVLCDVSKSKTKMTVYATREMHFRNYIEMLELDIPIKSETDLKYDIKNSSLPTCFWILNAHEISNIFDLVNTNTYHIIYETSYKGAFGKLFTHRDNKEQCSLQYQ